MYDKQSVLIAPQQYEKSLNEFGFTIGDNVMFSISSMMDIVDCQKINGSFDETILSIGKFDLTELRKEMSKVN